MWKIEFIVWAPTIFHLLLMFPQACVCLQNLCKLCSSVNNYVIFVCMRTQKRAEIHTYKKKTTPKKGRKGKWLPTDVPDDRRLSGNELLSCICWIFQALGKAEMASIFVCDTPSGEHSGRVFESMSQVDVSLTDGPALAGLLALRWRRGQYGSWNKENRPMFLSC